MQVNGDYRAFCNSYGFIVWYGVGTRPDYIWDTIHLTREGGSFPTRIDDADLRPLPRTDETERQPVYLYGSGAAQDILGQVGATYQGGPVFGAAVELGPSPGAFNLTGSYRSGSVGGNLAVLATTEPAPELVRIWEPTSP